MKSRRVKWFLADAVNQVAAGRDAACQVKTARNGGAGCHHRTLPAQPVSVSEETGERDARLVHIKDLIIFAFSFFLTAAALRCAKFRPPKRRAGNGGAAVSGA